MRARARARILLPISPEVASTPHPRELQSSVLRNDHLVIPQIVRAFLTQRRKEMQLLGIKLSGIELSPLKKRKQKRLIIFFEERQLSP